MTVDHSLIAAVNLVTAALFIPLLLIGTALTIARAVRTKLKHNAIPLVLKRDLVSRTGLTIPVAAIVVVRALGITNLGDNIVWVIVTDALFVISVGTYAFFEVFVIERPRYYERLQPDVMNAQMDRMEAKLDHNTEVSQGARDDAHEAAEAANNMNARSLAQDKQINEQGKQILAQGERAAGTADTIESTAAEVHDLHAGTAPEGREA